MLNQLLPRGYACAGLGLLYSVNQQNAPASRQADSLDICADILQRTTEYAPPHAIFAMRNAALVLAIPVLLASGTLAATYGISDDIIGSTFYDAFSFQTIDDPTHGNVWVLAFSCSTILLTRCFSSCRDSTFQIHALITSI
jgi:hypothetical protein